MIIKRLLKTKLDLLRKIKIINWINKIKIIINKKAIETNKLI
jgi:hypothetical protein